MTIAILNDCFLTPQHLNRLKQLGNVITYTNGTRSEKQAIERLKNVDIAVVDALLTPYNKKVLESTTQLKLLEITSTGYDMVDIQTATEKDIKVANVPGYSKESVAEFTFGLMLATARGIVRGDKKFRSHPVDDLDHTTEEGKEFIGFDLRGKTLGIIGLGRIGTAVAELAHGFGMKILGYNRTPRTIEHVILTSLEDLLKKSDVVSIHLALTPETRHIIGKRELSYMKPSSILINVARAGHVDTDALREALKEKKIFGAGLDVTEIHDANHPILSLENVVFAPHIASYTREAFTVHLPNMIVENIESFAAGKPIHIVN